MTPNVGEAEFASEIEIKTEQDIERAGRKLMEMLKSEAFVITRGASGVSVFEKQNPMNTFKAKAREVYDVTGAGDTFISHFGLGIFSGLSVEDSAELGNFAASIVVEKIGVASVRPEELAEFISDECFKTKFLEQGALQKKIKTLKNKGKKIVFTNGCFDLIHVGHIKYLQKAKDLGDYLIVALNSDSSVRRIKGVPRPIINETDRVHLISAIEAVDFVVVFNEDEPVSLIKKLQPDILVKGKNIPIDEVVGKDIVEKYGGIVIRLPFYQGISTNTIINEIAKSKNS